MFVLDKVKDEIRTFGGRRLATPLRERIPTADPERLVMEVSDFKGVPTVHCKGELDVYTSPWFHELAQQSLASHHSLAIDLVKIEYLDASFLRVLVQISKQARNLGGNICLVISTEQEHIHRIFEITKLNQIFCHSHDLETARQLLS